MPESTPAAAPESTSSIIETAIADLEPDSGEMPEFGLTDDAPTDADRGAGTGTSNTVTGTAATTTPAASTSAPVTQADIDELARELGIVAQGTAKWTSRVAYSKVKKIVDARDAKLKADHDAAIKQHTDRIAQFEQAVQSFDQMVGNPDLLLANLARIHPAYAKYATPQTGNASNPSVPQRVETMADLQRVIDAQVSARLQPYEQERASRAAIEQAIPRVKQQLEAAKAWPLFTESQGEILAALKSDPRMTLEAAYQKVVFPKITTQRDAIRQEVLAELNARPHATTVTSTVTGRTAPDTGPQDTADIVAEAIRKLK